MAKIVTYHGRFRRNRATETGFLFLVALAHLAILRLMIDHRVVTRINDPRSSPTITTFNILASSEAPPARSAPNPKASAISLDVDVPTIAIEDPLPIAAGLGAALTSDPYAGAAPVGDGFAKPVTAPIPVQRPKVAIPAGNDVFSRWLIDLRAKLTPMLAQESAPLKQIQAEIFAQPTGGFIEARIVQGSGDLAIDRQILVDLMRHKELIDAGMVGEAKWLALPIIDLSSKQ